MKWHLILLLSILVWTSDIVCAQEGDSHVLVREPMVILVPRFKLPQLCATKVEVEACTAFVGQRLLCECGRKDGAWAISSTAQFIPVMYVLGADHVSHERGHIRDVERSLAAYIGAQELLRFESLDACRRTAAEQMAHFPATMDRFKRESNEARHPSYRAAQR